MGCRLGGSGLGDPCETADDGWCAAPLSSVPVARGERRSFIFLSTKAGFFLASLSFLNKYKGFSFISSRRFVRFPGRFDN